MVGLLYAQRARRIHRKNQSRSQRKLAPGHDQGYVVPVRWKRNRSFGVVKTGSFGLLTITAKNGSIAPVSVNVTNGGFSVPSLAAVRGEFTAVFQQNGGSTFVRNNLSKMRAITFCSSSS